jgi:hypothetical protein
MWLLDSESSYLHARVLLPTTDSVVSVAETGGGTHTAVSPDHRLSFCINEWSVMREAGQELKLGHDHYVIREEMLGHKPTIVVIVRTLAHQKSIIPE